MRECFEGVKHFLLIFVSHFLLSFESCVNLKVPTLDVELFLQLIATQNILVFPWNSLWTWNQNCFKFPAFPKLTNNDVTSFISDNSHED